MASYWKKPEADDILQKQTTEITLHFLQIRKFLTTKQKKRENIDLYMNTNKTRFICLKQKKKDKTTIFTLRGKTVKLLVQLIYLGSYTSPYESKVDMHLVKM